MSCDCEPVRFYSEKIRTSRKNHKCCECSLLILPGEKYEYVSLMVDDIESYKTCLKCAQVRNWLAEQIDCCIEFGGLKNELIESGTIDRVEERIYVDGSFDRVEIGEWFVSPDCVNEVELIDGLVRLKNVPN